MHNKYFCRILWAFLSVHISQLTTLLLVVEYGGILSKYEFKEISDLKFFFRRMKEYMSKFNFFIFFLFYSYEFQFRIQKSSKFDVLHCKKVSILTHIMSKWTLLWVKKRATNNCVNRYTHLCQLSCLHSIGVKCVAETRSVSNCINLPV